jgi:acyl carrier protein
VIEFLSAGMSQPAAAAGPVTVSGTGGASAASPGDGEAASILLAVVSETTGYPPEMLDLDLNLDTDLGIDSIKRVEIFSALAEKLPGAPAVGPEHLARLQTLRQVIEFLTGGNGHQLPQADESAPLKPAKALDEMASSVVSLWNGWCFTLLNIIFMAAKSR